MNELFLHPEISNKILLAVSLLLLLASIWKFQNGSHKAGIFLLLAGALGVRVFMALLDPFLNIWDEQYHALVARNLAENPLLPLLHKSSPVPVNPLIWTDSHIWLHKQPLFLWQMALSLKIFGFNEFALRLPSVLMSTLMVYMIYRIGKLALNPTLGFYSAFLFAISYFSLELMNGRLPTDHNDTAFLFYTTASFWAWIEYYRSKSLKWAVLVGIFSGAAILVKWLVGFLVFFGWGVIMLVNEKHRILKSAAIKPFLVALAIAIAIPLPWQIYIFLYFPEVAAFEYKFAASHFWEVIEGQEGNFLFHLERMKMIFGFSIWFILLGLGLFYYFIKEKNIRIFFFSTISIVYLFYSLAATKMNAFGIISTPVVYIALGMVFYSIRHNLNFSPAGKWIAVGFLIFSAQYAFDSRNLQRLHTVDFERQAYRGYLEGRRENTRIFKQLQKEGLDGYLIFNCKKAEHIPAMFFTGYQVHDFIPDSTLFAKILSENRKIAVFTSDSLPTYLQGAEVKKLPALK
jgi:4-amino-4-deoxy-L-arabinose transferase-like glycosyltransferase